MLLAVCEFTLMLERFRLAPITTLFVIANEKELVLDHDRTGWLSV